MIPPVQLATCHQILIEIGVERDPCRFVSLLHVWTAATCLNPNPLTCLFHTRACGCCPNQNALRLSRSLSKVIASSRHVSIPLLPCVFVLGTPGRCWSMPILGTDLLSNKVNIQCSWCTKCSCFHASLSMCHMCD